MKVGEYEVTQTASKCRLCGNEAKQVSENKFEKPYTGCATPHCLVSNNVPLANWEIWMGPTTNSPIVKEVKVGQVYGARSSKIKGYVVIGLNPPHASISEGSATLLAFDKSGRIISAKTYNVKTLQGMRFIGLARTEFPQYVDVKFFNKER